MQEKTCYLLTDKYTIRYFTKEVIAEGYLVVNNSEMALFTDSRYYFAVSEKLKDKKVKSLLFSGLDSIREYLDKTNAISIGVDYSKTTLKEFYEYKKIRENIFDCEKEVAVIRSIKQDEEIEKIKKSCEICQKSFYNVLPFIKKGITEKEIKELLIKSYISLGAEGESFDTIVAFGENASVPHHETSDRALKENEEILIDTGCIFNGYASDLTRTMFFGTPNEKFIEYYNLVNKANEVAEENIKVGDSLFFADSLSRNVFKKSGVDKYFTHSLGHGVGLEIHEYPYLSKNSKDGVLQENQVFTIEPGLYFDGELGIRIEDTVILKNGKIERLFTDKKDLIILK